MITTPYIFQSQASPTVPADIIIEEKASLQQGDPNSSKVFGEEQQLGGKGLSASHVIMRSKLHFEGDDRPFSKSTSRICEVTADTVALPKENEDTFPIPEDPPVIVQSESVLKSKLSKIA